MRNLSDTLQHLYKGIILAFPLFLYLRLFWFCANIHKTICGPISIYIFWRNYTEQNYKLRVLPWLNNSVRKGAGSKPCTGWHLVHCFFCSADFFLSQSKSLIILALSGSRLECYNLPLSKWWQASTKYLVTPEYTQMWFLFQKTDDAFGLSMH